MISFLITCAYPHIVIVHSIVQYNIRSIQVYPGTISQQQPAPNLQFHSILNPTVRGSEEARGKEGGAGKGVLPRRRGDVRVGVVMTMPFPSTYSTADDLHRFGVRRSGSSRVGLASSSVLIVMSLRFRFVGVFVGGCCGCGCRGGGGANGDNSLK